MRSAWDASRKAPIEVISVLDLVATPPFDYAHDHFGYRDRMSQPVVEGSRHPRKMPVGDPATGRAGRTHPPEGARASRL
jgi:hypothetical protein